jgi:hypothetical protein
MLRDVAGLNEVLFGADFPYLRRDIAINSKQRILQSSELNELERRTILWGNASQLFPRLYWVNQRISKTVRGRQRVTFIDRGEVAHESGGNPSRRRPRSIEV